jgi:hypothetical protein
LSGLWRAAADAAEVLTVSVAVTGPVPEIAAGCAAEQVGVPTAPDGLAVTAQVSATLPVKPPLGVSVMVEVALAPGDAMLMGVPLSVKDGVAAGPARVIAMVVASVKVPEFPVNVAV